MVAGLYAGCQAVVSSSFCAFFSVLGGNVYEVVRHFL